MKTITSFFSALMLLIGNNLHSQNPFLEINSDLEATTRSLINSFDRIDENRKIALQEFGDFLVEQLNHHDKFKVLFVCTHNSRRSHIADLWFKYGMYYYGIEQFESFSGGMEATAFNPKAIEAIERAGFNVVYDKKVENPVVSVTPKSYPIWRMKSKVYNDKLNPGSDFVAVMVCSDADKSCPTVEGATGRFAFPYNDPRYFDNTPSEKQEYDMTVELIGTEMLYLVHYMKIKIITKAESEK